MTREEFIRDINDWGELIDFCCDNQCDICDDIYSEDARDSYIDEQLVDKARTVRTWKELYEELDEIPTDSEYYILDDWDGSWIAAGDYDFDERKRNVRDWMDDGGYWDDDEDENNDGDEDHVEEEYAPAYRRNLFEVEEDDGERPEEGCTFAELFVSSECVVASAQAVARSKQIDEERRFHDLFESIGG